MHCNMQKPAVFSVFHQKEHGGDVLCFDVQFGIKLDVGTVQRPLQDNCKPIKRHCYKYVTKFINWL